MNTRNSHVYCPIWVKFCMHVILFGFCGFRWNRRREGGYTFRAVVNSITFTVGDIRNSQLQSVYCVTERTADSVVYCVTERTADSVVFRRSEEEQTSRKTDNYKLQPTRCNFSWIYFYRRSTYFYKSEGRGFYSRWCQWNFSLT